LKKFCQKRENAAKRSEAIEAKKVASNIYQSISNSITDCGIYFNI